MFQNILEDVIAIEEEASTNNDKLQCVFCKKYFENQPEKIYIWHYGIMKKLKSQMNSKMKKKFQMNQ